MDKVSILAQPPGRALPGSGNILLPSQQFQSSPNLPVGRYKLADQAARALKEFQSSPNLPVGRYLRFCTFSQVYFLFQSSPNLPVGRYTPGYHL